MAVLRFAYFFVLQDKWLCPLSGKKFKGPDFVRKHIMTKHVEKVDEVKKEVNFFNNYLRVSLVFQLICDYIMVYHRTQSGLSCLSILRRRQVLEERVAQVRTGGRGGEEILTSTGNICLLQIICSLSSQSTWTLLCCSVVRQGI